MVIDVKSPSYMAATVVAVLLATSAMARGPVLSRSTGMAGPSSRVSPPANAVGSRGQIPAPQWRGGFSGSAFHHHRHNGGNVSVFIAGSWWYPGWCYDWWYWPPPYYGYYDAGYQFSPGAGVAASYVVPENRSNDYTLGYTWGLDLRLRIVTWNQFVAAVKTFYPNAPEPSRDEFRRGFVAGYGNSAQAAFEKALKEAIPQPPASPPSIPPKATTVPRT